MSINRVGIFERLSFVDDFPEFDFDFLEGHTKDFVEIFDKLGEHEFKSHIRSLPYRPDFIGRLFPKSLKLTGSGRNLANICEYCEKVFYIANLMEVKAVVLGSGSSRRADSGQSMSIASEVLCESLKSINSIADRFDLQVGLEPLNKGECNLINSLADGEEIISNCGLGNFRLVADSFHLSPEVCSLRCSKSTRSRVIHAHIAETESRKYPGYSGECFLPFLTFLDSLPNCDSVSIEVTWLDEERGFAGESLQYVKDQINRLG